MSTFYLINNIRVGSYRLYAGSLVNDAYELLAPIRAAGGVLVASSNARVAAAAVLAQKFRKRGAPILELAEVMEAALNATHERFPKGANLVAGDQTVKWSDGLRRVMPAATMAGAVVITLAVTAGADGRLPAAGDRWQFTRLDATANTLAFLNGGTGAGTLATLAVSKVGYAEFEFDGVDWGLVQAAPT